MTTENDPRTDEYRYSDSALGCAADYLLPILNRLLAQVPSGATLVDLGCGNGSMLSQFRSRGWTLHGLEMSRSGIAQAEQSYPDITFSYADLTTAITHHPLQGRCDVVLSTEVVEHVLLPRIYASNCNSFLKSGGLLLISTPYHGYLKNVVLSLTGKMDSHFTALWDYGHIKFWSRRTLSLLLEEAGFDIIAFEGAGRIPYLWKSMVVLARKR